MANPIKDLTGKRFGRLTVIRRVGTYRAPSGPTDPIWECRCDCGKVVNVRRPALSSGCTTSCGCYRTEQVIKANKARAERRKREVIT